jgi:hypothetical protein
MALGEESVGLGVRLRVFGVAPRDWRGLGMDSRWRGLRSDRCAVALRYWDAG